MAGPVEHFILEPWRLGHLGLWKFRLSQALHERTNGGFDALYRRWAKLTRPTRALPAPRWLAEGDIEAVVEKLKAEGCCVLPKRLDASDVAEIRAFAFSEPAYARGPEERIAIRPGAIPTEEGRYQWRMDSLVRLGAVRRLATDSSLHRIAQGYLGARPVLSHVTLWLDPPYQGRFDPHIYHYDNDGPGFLKFFIYLTDVEHDTGAHRFIKGTHDHRKPAPYRLSKRYDEDELLRHFGAQNEVVFTAPAGTVIAEDTAGFHRGSTVKRDHRLLMQFQYSLLDIPHVEELVRPIEPLPLNDLHPAIAPAVSKFYTPAG